VVEQGNRAFEWGRFANRPYENVRECGPLKTERHEPLPRAARVVGATGGESGVTRRVVAGGAIPVAPGPWRARYPAILSFCASPVKETYTYNNRLQVSGIQLSTPQYPSAYSLTYNYSLPGGSQPPGCPLVPAGSGNNGNVIGYTYTDTVSSGMNHSALYVYDTLNRLACAQATGSATYNLAFTYDRYGNMACQTNGQTNGPCPNWTFNSSANQITTAGYTYDAAGNVTSDNLTNYQWDAEGRLKSVNNGAARSYVYNALGREAEWHGDGRVSEDLTDLAGHYLGSVDPSTGAWTGERIPGSSIYLAWYVNGGTPFFHYNALGSSMMNTHQDGNTVSNDVLFYPWGQMWASPVNDYFQFFGNIEGWDWEIGEGVTPNRYYPNYQGRWLSPDPAGLKAVKLDDPQTWNMYAYVRNNPTTNTDPTGLACVAGLTLFGSHFGGRCASDTPPPPPPPPPSPLQTDQKARTALMAPTRPSSRTETVYQIGGIVNAETRGMKDSKSENVPLSKAREEIAEVRINGDQLYGDKVGKYAGMQPPNYSGPDFQASLDAAANAAYNKLIGVSDTGDATNYQMTKSTDDTGPFYGLPIYTTAGPYLSPTPYTVINTYGPIID